MGTQGFNFRLNFWPKWVFLAPNFAFVDKSFSTATRLSGNFSTAKNFRGK